MTAVRMVVARKTDMGRVRTNNEDALAILDVTTGARLDPAVLTDTLDVGEKGILLALSDGMGGHEAGEVASALVLESLCTAIAAGGEGAMDAQMDAAVRKANAAVADAARDQGKKGMGATLTAVLVNGEIATIAEVGDSRAYLLRGEKIRQITRDQSLVQLLVDTGALSPEEARTSPQKNVILQAMGLAEDVRVAIGRLQLRRFDTILLCCDGLSNAITDDELKEILSVDDDPGRACTRLIDLANERGGEDNLTAIVARLDGDGLPHAAFGQSVTDTFEQLQDLSPPSVKPAGTPAAQAPTATPELAAVASAPAVLPEPPAAPATQPASPPVASAPPAKSGGTRWIAWVVVVIAVVAAFVARRILQHP